MNRQEVVSFFFTLLIFTILLILVMLSNKYNFYFILKFSHYILFSFYSLGERKHIQEKFVQDRRVNSYLIEL